MPVGCRALPGSHSTAWPGPQALIRCLRVVGTASVVQLPLDFTRFFLSLLSCCCYLFISSSSSFFFFFETNKNSCSISERKKIKAAAQKKKKKVRCSLCLYNLKPPVFKFGLDTYFCSTPVSAWAHGTHMLASVDLGALIFNITLNLQSWTKLTKIVE